MVVWTLGPLGRSVLEQNLQSRGALEASTSLPLCRLKRYSIRTYSHAFTHTHNHQRVTAPHLKQAVVCWTLGLILLEGHLTDAKGYCFFHLFVCFLKMGKRQLSPNSKCHMDLEICVDHRQALVSGMATYQIQELRKSQEGTTLSWRRGSRGGGTANKAFLP